MDLSLQVGPDMVPRGCRPVVARSPVDLEVVVPAFDEEDRIEATLRSLTAELSARPWRSRIVVVDNGSTDRTAEVADRWARRFPVQVIGCSRQGRGAAVRRGFLTSTARWVGYCDADGAQLARLIAPAVQLLAAGRRAVVATRHLVGRVGSRRPAGFQFFDAALARRLAARSRLTGRTFDRELPALARGAGVPVAELPVDWRDHHGPTLRTFADRLRDCRESLVLRLLAAEPVDLPALDPGLFTDGLPAATSQASGLLDRPLTGGRTSAPPPAEVHDDSASPSGAQLA